MNNLLLQINNTAVETVAEASNSAGSTSIFELLLEGGWTMVPLLLLSIWSIYIFVERFLSLQKASKDPSDFMDSIKIKVVAGDLEGAKLLCSQTQAPVARMIEKGLHRIGSPLKNIETSIENVGRIEIFKLEKNLSSLATISGAAPMIGFFGTVTGMIKAFIAIAEQEGAVSPKDLAGGIYEAMITTAAGLFVGIIAYVAYNYLTTKVNSVVENMESSTISFIDLLQEPQ